MNTPAIVVNPTTRMTSLQIAEICDKNHHDVLRDIRNLLDQEAIGQSNFALSSYTNSQNKEQPMYSLDFKATMTLVTGYDAKRRAAVIDRWMKLETGEAVPMAAAESGLVTWRELSPLIESMTMAVSQVSNLAIRLESMQIAVPPDCKPRRSYYHPGNIPAFIEACCLVGHKEIVSKAILVDRYSHWCYQGQNGFMKCDADFFKILYRQGLDLRTVKITDNGERRSYLEGIGLKEVTL